jgi:hypothetical protein
MCLILDMLCSPLFHQTSTCRRILPVIECPTSLILGRHFSLSFLPMALAYPQWLRIVRRGFSALDKMPSQFMCPISHEEEKPEVAATRCLAVNILHPRKKVEGFEKEQMIKRLVFPWHI